MKKVYLSVLCGAALLCSAANVQARPERMERPRPEHVQRMEKDLAEKLKLTDEQKAKAEKIREDGRAEMKKMHEKMQELRKANMAAFEEILTPEQKAEFEKIKAEHKPGKMKGRRGGKHQGFGPADELPPPPPPAE